MYNTSQWIDQRCKYLTGQNSSEYNNICSLLLNSFSFHIVASAEGWWCGKYCRLSNALCKQPFSLAVGAIPGSDSNVEETLFGLVRAYPLPELPGMPLAVSGRGCLNEVLWHLQYLPFSPSGYTNPSQVFLSSLA